MPRIKPTSETCAETFDQRSRQPWFVSRIDRPDHLFDKCRILAGTDAANVYVAVAATSAVAERIARAMNAQRKVIKILANIRDELWQERYSHMSAEDFAADPTIQEIDALLKEEAA